MNRKFGITVVAVALTVGSSVRSADAQNQKQVEIPPVLINDKATAAASVHPATPYFESTSCVLLELDTAQIDPVSVLKWINQTTENDFDESLIQPELELFQSLHEDGVQGLFAIASLRSVAERFPLIVLPTHSASKAEAFSGLLRKWIDVRQVPTASDQWGVRSDQSNTLLGVPAAIDRAMDPSPAGRWELTQRDSDEAAFPHRISVVLNEDIRSDLVLLLPEQMPSQWGIQMNPRQAISDIRRVVVSWRMPPQPELRIRLETDDLAAAERTKKLATGLLLQFTGRSDAFEVECADQRVVLSASEAQVITQLKVLIPNSSDRIQMAKQKSLARLSLALHNFNSAFRHLPAGVYTDPDGSPLYGWRTAILPFLDQAALWQAMDRKQAWNSDANAAVRKAVVPAYATTGDHGSDEAFINTTLRAPVFPGSVWHGNGTPPAIDDATDGLKETIVLIDAPAESAVEWSNPDQWILAEDDVIGQIFGDRDEVMVVMLWGEVRTLQRSELTEAKLKSMLTMSSGD